MAEHDDGEERTEQPTAKRIREARERGQVPRSRELGGAAMLGATVLLLGLHGGEMARGALRWMRGALSFTREDMALGDPLVRAARLLGELMGVAAPLIVVGILAGTLAPLALSGFNFSSKALLPDFSRINPLAGLRRLYSLPSLAEIAKSVLRVVLIGSIGWIALRNELPALLGLADEALEPALAHGGAIALSILRLLTLALVGVAAIDVPWQIWQHRHQLRMTRQEIRDELKESEGNPEIRARIRRAQQALANRRMLEAVPRADAVIVNPTHYAVAIVYDAKRMRAPRVVAKGVDLIAQTIREVAEQHRVPIVSAPPLARALYRQVELDREIPVRLYAAVAQILSFVYQLRAYRRHGGRMPKPPEIDVPEGAD